VEGSIKKPQKEIKALPLIKKERALKLD